MGKRIAMRKIDFLLALMIGFILFAPDDVLASHRTWAHNRYIHSSEWNELVCVDTSGSSMSFSSGLNLVKNTLRYTNTSSDWHGLAVNRVYFTFKDSSCGSLSSLGGIRARTYVRNDTSGPCACTNCSCVTRGSTVATHNGYTDTSYENIYLKTSHLTGTTAFAQHVINHEYGHMLGLADGSGSNCSNDSIMHPSYYCSGNTNYSWPTSNDRSAVTSIANMINISPPPQ